jgi:hypothetical protein
MKQIPMPLVKANQVVMVLGTLTAILLQSPIVLTMLFFIVLFPFLFGPKGNLVFLIAKPLLRSRLNNAETEAIELQRFNQTIASVMLGIATVIMWTVGHWSGWIVVSMVTIAAMLALSGYCVGCFLYFQLKRWKHSLVKNGN